MYNVLVLGYVPGTNIQISFQAWLGIAVVLVGALAILYVERRQHQTPFRLPLPASRLHVRLQSAR